MPDRRYTDSEVTEIFRRATAAPPPRHAGSEGMSLAELQDIGHEVGLAPEAVTAAARSLDAVEPAAPETLIGLPIGVRHAVELDRRLGDAEWDHLVVAARDTFAARGNLRADGAFRQWTNGNLQMLLEPGADGHRLRFRTLNGHARRMILGGITMLGVATTLSAVTLLSGVPDVADSLQGMAILGLIGAAMLARGLWGLRDWAARRQAQFQRLADMARGEG
jgi:hypothetical protein